MAPGISIEATGCRADAARPGRWLAGWEIRNDLASPIELSDAWLPHGQFRGEGHVALARSIPAGGATDLELPVVVTRPDSGTVRNAFLILLIATEATRWRTFARMRVEFDADGQPQPIVETLTAQSVE